MSEQEPIKSVSKPGETKVFDNLYRGSRRGYLSLSFRERPTWRLNSRGARPWISFSTETIFHHIGSSIQRDPRRACPQAMSSISDLRLWTMQRHSR